MVKDTCTYVEEKKLLANCPSSNPKAKGSNKLLKGVKVGLFKYNF